jgi:pyridoxamine 5'-phosphate oxidase
VLFEAWLAEAVLSEPNDPNAMALATATAAGVPSVRMVLLKGHGPDGFVFYTNAESRKGDEIRANPRAALLFHWKSLHRQVRIEGALEGVSATMADAYFASRHPDSRLGSAASDQSRPLDSRTTYLDRVEALRARYPDGEVPRPPHGTGFRLVPERFGFWLARPHRLHERRQFTRADGGWASTQLYP